MKVLITGGTGMLGRSVHRRLVDGHEVRAPGSRDLDVVDARAVEATIAGWRPDAVIHCAAHTKVDLCETETDRAFAINAVGSANVAGACHRHGAKLFAISTDYVFAGDLDRPYHEWDATVPRTVYGQSKLAGEEAVRAHCPRHVIARIAWLYGPGGPSFVHTMRKAGTQDGAALRVVDDQVGNPTSTLAVADALARLLDHPLVGTVHLTCAGEVSWFGFTQQLAVIFGFRRTVLPCSTAEFPRPAPRPANSRLEKRVLRLHGLDPMPAWQDDLGRFALEFPHG